MTRRAVWIPVMLLGAWGAAATQGPALSGPDRTWLRGEAARVRRDIGAAGIVVGVARRGDVVFVEGDGAADLDGRRPVGPDTRFRVASVTKPVTATAVLQLAAAGRLSLDAPVREICPVYPAKRPAGPTVRQVLAHRSGIPHTSDAEDTTIAGAFSRASDAVPLMADKPLAFAPGSATLYSSWGYALLGCVIESAAGRPYWDVVRDDVLARAGVRGAARDAPDFDAPDFSPGYRAGRLYGLRPSLVVDTRFKTPASGLIISAADLLRFLLALTDDTLLPAAFRAEMFRPASAGGGEVVYTPGWQVTTPLSGAAAVVHSGSMEGVTALVYLVPSQRDAVVILANRERAVPGVVPLLRAIVARLFGGAASSANPDFSGSN